MTLTVEELIEELQKLPEHHKDAEVRSGPIEGGWILVEEAHLMSGRSILLLQTLNKTDEY